MNPFISNYVVESKKYSFTDYLSYIKVIYYYNKFTFFLKESKSRTYSLVYTLDQSICI